MQKKKFNNLETFKRKAIVPFDTSDATIAFTLHFDVSKSTKINVSWHLLCAAVFSILMLFSIVYCILVEANKFVEYLDLFFPICTLSVAFCSCILQVACRTKTIALIDSFEAVIDKREYAILGIFSSFFLQFNLHQI